MLDLGNRAEDAHVKAIILGSLWVLQSPHYQPGTWMMRLNILSM